MLGARFKLADQSLPTIWKRLATDETLCRASVQTLKLYIADFSHSDYRRQQRNANLNKADAQVKLNARLLTLGIA